MNDWFLFITIRNGFSCNYLSLSNTSEADHLMASQDTGLEVGSFLKA